MSKKNLKGYVSKPSGSEYFMTQGQMSEARWLLSVFNSRRKRGELSKDACPNHVKCGCGCGVYIVDREVVK